MTPPCSFCRRESAAIQIRNQPTSEGIIGRQIPISSLQTGHPSIKVAFRCDFWFLAPRRSLCFKPHPVLVPFFVDRRVGVLARRAQPGAGGLGGLRRLGADPLPPGLRASGLRLTVGGVPRARGLSHSMSHVTTKHPENWRVRRLSQKWVRPSFRFFTWVWVGHVNTCFWL